MCSSIIIIPMHGNCSVRPRQFTIPTFYPSHSNFLSWPLWLESIHSIYGASIPFREHTCPEHIIDITVQRTLSEIRSMRKGCTDALVKWTIPEEDYWKTYSSRPVTTTQLLVDRVCRKLKTTCTRLACYTIPVGELSSHSDYPALL